MGCVNSVGVQVKSENYDGSVHKEDEPTQWSFTGSLLYCVTIVTTIGELNLHMLWSLNEKESDIFQDTGTLHQRLTGVRL